MSLQPPQPHAQPWPVDQPFTLGQMASPPKRRNKMFWAVLALAATVIVLGGLLVAVLLIDDKPGNPLRAVVGPDEITVDGIIVLFDDDGFGGSSECYGRGGYRDIRQGAQVTITDSAGATVALGNLGPGERANGGCTFTFRVEKVPAGKGFYGVEISHRGVIKYPEHDISTRKLELSLGDR